MKSEGRTWRRINKANSNAISGIVSLCHNCIAFMHTFLMLMLMMSVWLHECVYSECTLFSLHCTNSSKTSNGNPYVCSYVYFAWWRYTCEYIYRWFGSVHGIAALEKWIWQTTEKLFDWWSFRLTKVHVLNYSASLLTSTRLWIYTWRWLLTFILPTCIQYKYKYAYTYIKKHTKEIITGNVWFQVWICSCSASTDLPDEEKEKRAFARLNYEPVRHSTHTYTYKHTHRPRAYMHTALAHRAVVIMCLIITGLKMLPNRTKFTNESHVIVIRPPHYVVCSWIEKAIQTHTLTSLVY